MLKNSLFAFTALCTVATVASADEEPTPTPTPTPTPMAPAGGAGPFSKGAMGISVAVPGAAPGYVVDFVYFLSDKAALDLLGGIVFSHAAGKDATATLPAVPGTDAFGFSVGLGYRMYTTKGAVLHTYLQPFGLISSLDVAHIGDTIGIQAGLNFGAEAFVNDWLSFRGQIGGAFAATSASKTFSNIGIASTTGLFANVYWK